jgi:hypothetical protein
VEFLDLPSQLNVEANTLATKELHKYGRVKSQVPFDLASGVQLNIEGRTITQQLTTAIHNQQHLAPLQHYFCTCFQWDGSSFDSINWSTFDMVYKRFPRQRTFYSKFGWKKLLVASHLFKHTLLQS